MVLWRPTRPSRMNTPKRCPFHYRGLECKSRKSRNIWSKRQIWPWSTEWSRPKALPRESTGHSKHPLLAMSQWCHPTISSSAVRFSSCLQSFPASGLFLMSRLFDSGGQSVGVSSSSEYLGLISFRIGWFDFLAVQGLLRVFSNTTVQKHQLFST